MQSSNDAKEKLRKQLVSQEKHPEMFKDSYITKKVEGRTGDTKEGPLISIRRFCENPAVIFGFDLPADIKSNLNELYDIGMKLPSGKFLPDGPVTQLIRDQITNDITAGRIKSEAEGINQIDQLYAQFLGMLKEQISKQITEEDKKVYNEAKGTAKNSTTFYSKMNNIINQAPDNFKAMMSTQQQKASAQIAAATTQSKTATPPSNAAKSTASSAPPPPSSNHYTNDELSVKIRGNISQITHTWSLLKESGMLLNKHLQKIDKKTADQVLTSLKSAVTDLIAYNQTKDIVHKFVQDEKFNPSELIKSLDTITENAKKQPATSYDTKTTIEPRWKAMQTSLTTKMDKEDNRITTIKARIKVNIDGVATQAMQSVNKSVNKQEAAKIWNERLEGLYDVANTWKTWVETNSETLAKLPENEYTALVSMLTHSVHRFAGAPFKREEIQDFFLEKLADLKNGVPDNVKASGMKLEALQQPITSLMAAFKSDCFHEKKVGPEVNDWIRSQMKATEDEHKKAHSFRSILPSFMGSARDTAIARLNNQFAYTNDPTTNSKAWIREAAAYCNEKLSNPKFMAEVNNSTSGHTLFKMLATTLQHISVNPDMKHLIAGVPLSPDVFKINPSEKITPPQAPPPADMLHVVNSLASASAEKIIEGASLSSDLQTVIMHIWNGMLEKSSCYKSEDKANNLIDFVNGLTVKGDPLQSEKDALKTLCQHAKALAPLGEEKAISKLCEMHKISDEVKSALFKSAEVAPEVQTRLRS